jgi:hypothetical protein
MIAVRYSTNIVLWGVHIHNIIREMIVSLNIYVYTSNTIFRNTVKQIPTLKSITFDTLPFYQWILRRTEDKTRFQIKYFIPNLNIVSL